MSIYHSTLPVRTSVIRGYPTTRVATSTVVRATSPVRTSVIRAASPVRTSVIRAASPVRTSVIRAASPVRTYTRSIVSPVRSYARWASPVRSYTRSVVSPIRSYATSWAAPVRAYNAPIRTNTVVDPVTRIVGDGYPTSAIIGETDLQYAKEVAKLDENGENAQIFESLEGEEVQEGEPVYEEEVAYEGELADAIPQEGEVEAELQVVNLDDEEEAEVGEGQEELSNHGDDQEEEVNAEPVVEDDN